MVDRRRLWRSTWTRWLMVMAGVLGVVAIAELISHIGWQSVWHVTERAGFGLLWLIPLRLFAVGLDTRGWGALLQRSRRASWMLLFWLGMVRDAVNTLLPVARVGGEVVAVRLLGLRGVKLSTASASVIVETSVTLVWQVLLTFAGIVFLLPYVGVGPLVAQLLGGSIVAVIVVIVFIMVQVRFGLVGLFERVIKRVWGDSHKASTKLFRSLDQKVWILYRQRMVLLRCASWQLAGFAGSAAEIFLMSRLMHVHLGWTQVFVFESLVQAIHSVSFVVPGALGVQEGGFVLLGLALGVNPDAALSFALVRRLRQIGLGLPTLASWYVFERRHRRRGSEELAAEWPAAST